MAIYLNQPFLIDKRKIKFFSKSLHQFNKQPINFNLVVSLKKLMNNKLSYSSKLSIYRIFSNNFHILNNRLDLESVNLIKFLLLIITDIYPTTIL